MDLGLDGKRCFVTGSTSGIGLEIVRQLGGEGARVVSCGRRGAPGAGEVGHVAADLSLAVEPGQAVAEVVRTYYVEQGWDAVTGVPTAETIRALEIEEDAARAVTR